MMTSIRAPRWLLVVACGVVLGSGLAISAENQLPDRKAVADAALVSVTDAERTEAKAIFAAQCGSCHGDYGMQAGKGPRLAGTEMTEHEVEQRIRNGKPGYMPPFHKLLNDEQIALVAKYIKSLKPPS
jgi:mono/diheme cytochrome c family protein